MKPHSTEFKRVELLSRSVESQRFCWLHVSHSVAKDLAQHKLEDWNSEALEEREPYIVCAFFMRRHHQGFPDPPTCEQQCPGLSQSPLQGWAQAARSRQVARECKGSLPQQFNTTALLRCWTAKTDQEMHSRLNWKLEAEPWFPHWCPPHISHMWSHDEPLATAINFDTLEKGQF